MTFETYWECNFFLSKKLNNATNNDRNLNRVKSKGASSINTSVDENFTCEFGWSVVLIVHTELIINKWKEFHQNSTMPGNSFFWLNIYLLWNRLTKWIFLSGLIAWVNHGASKSRWRQNKGEEHSIAASLFCEMLQMPSLGSTMSIMWESCCTDD